MCRRGDIYYIDFGENIYTCKQSGIRPAVVVSNNKANEHSPVITVVPLTSKVNKKKFLPTHVYIPFDLRHGLSYESVALAEQVETIDKDCILEKMGVIANIEIMEKITKAIQVQIGVFEEYN